MKRLRKKIGNIIHNFFHLPVESIVEKQNITEEEAKELLKILEEWEKQNIQSHM